VCEITFGLQCHVIGTNSATDFWGQPTSCLAWTGWTGHSEIDCCNDFITAISVS
jgi:hypothetical protein